MTDQHTSLSVGRNGEGQGASAEADRAVVNGAASVSAVPASVPSAGAPVHEDTSVDPLQECLRETYGAAAPEFVSAFRSALQKRAIQIVAANDLLALAAIDLDVVEAVEEWAASEDQTINVGPVQTGQDEHVASSAQAAVILMRALRPILMRVRQMAGAE